MVNTTDSETLPKSINNGPRVSFNRDVHVKRYGSQSNHNDSLNHDSLTSRSQSPVNFRRELPADLSEEALEREAALVLEQANYFGSLPHRKNQQRKPVRRSISDASSKKSKRSSIFNIFNVLPTTNSPSPVNNKRITNDRNATNKKVERSKSDVSQSSKRDKNRVHLKSNSFNNHQTNSSDSSDNANNFLTSTPKKKAPLSPITEVNTPLVDVNNRTDYFGQLLEKSKLTNGKSFASTEDLDLIPTSDKMASKYSKSAETMHSSQMPAEKPTLTKGVALNRMIKRLSVETLAPPAQVLQAGGFSYTNPQLSPVSPVPYSPTKHKSLSPPLTKSDIVYAQVVCNESKNVDGSKTITSKETVHNTLKKNRQSTSPPANNNQSSNKFDSVDHFVITASPSPPTRQGGNQNSYQYRNSVKLFDLEQPQSFLTEDVIKPNIRKQIPRYSSNTNINHHQNEFDNEMRDTDFNGFERTLSNRREILESRIKSRIGGLHINNNDNHIRLTSSSPPTTKRYHKYGSNEIINRYSPERNHLDLVHSPSPPSFERIQSKNYADSTLRKKSDYYSKHNEKGDSGIEVDHVTKRNRRNKQSSRFNLGRKWNYEDDIIECELFLMKEKKHTEETYPFQLVRTFVYRERSIDDGSHYDPNLDKANIIKEWKHNKKITKDFIKSKKKKSGLEKVKDLFKSKKSNGVDDVEVKSRYREYSPNLEPPPSVHQQDFLIANRRRLSTPTASPVITNRSKSLPPKSKKLNGNVSSMSGTLKRDKENNAQKFNWFASLERLSKKKSREPSSTPSTIDRKTTVTRTKSTTLKNGTSNGSVSNKTLRFFGDTDRDEVDSISRVTSKKLTASQERLKSASLQNLNAQRKVKQTKVISRSRAELNDISESTSDTEFNGNDASMRRPPSPGIPKHLPPPRPPKSSKVVSAVSTTLPRQPRRKMYDDDNDREFLHRDVQESMPYYQKRENFESDSLSNLTSARKLRESLSASRENLHRERFDSDASQRSVVYLHATTVGDIPSQTLERRKVSGRNSIKTAIQEEKPMMRTVNRSVSLSAPWKPKFISDGYEINYNNDAQKNIN